MLPGRRIFHRGERFMAIFMVLIAPAILMLPVAQAATVNSQAAEDRIIRTTVIRSNDTGLLNLAHPVFDGTVSLEIPAGALASGTALVVREISGYQPAGPGLRLLSPVYDFAMGSANLKKPVVVIIRYNRSGLGGINPRKLGLYRQDASDPSRWIYAGGVVDASTGTLQSVLQELGRYAVLAYQHTFTDLEGHWSRKDVEELLSRQMMHGVNDRQFAPDSPITRAELVKLLLSMLGMQPGSRLEAGTVPTFNDVAPDNWHYNAIELAARLGIVKGSEGLFRPDDPVTREETASMLIRAIALKDGNNQVVLNAPPFRDACRVSPWAREAVALAWQKGFMQGAGGGFFLPAARATRAEAAVVVSRAMEQAGMISRLPSPLRK